MSIELENWLTEFYNINVTGASLLTQTEELGNFDDYQSMDDLFSAQPALF